MRSIYDPAIQGWWFSVTDLSAILTDNDHKTARVYWKHFKYKMTQESIQLVTESHQLKWQAIDGKYYFTEAVDFKNLLHLDSIPANFPFCLVSDSYHQQLLQASINNISKPWCNILFFA